MAVKARMYCGSIEGEGEEATYRNVKFHAVASSDPNNPNYSFSKYTPAAQLFMHITNPDAFNQFEVGKEYDLTFREVNNG